MQYGLNLELLNSLSKDIVVMHPGPINRGVEITSDVADSNQSIILDQVENGCRRANGSYVFISRQNKPLKTWNRAEMICTVFNVYNNTDLSTKLSQVNNLKTHLILEIAHFDQLPQEAISQCLQAKSDLNKRIIVFSFSCK